MGIGLTCAFIGRDFSKEVFRQPCQKNSFERNLFRPSLRPAGALPAECVFCTFPITEFARLGAPEDGAGQHRRELIRQAGQWRATAVSPACRGLARSALPRQLVAHHPVGRRERSWVIVISATRGL
jgi:hypothetical protein